LTTQAAQARAEAVLKAAGIPTTELRLERNGMLSDSRDTWGVTYRRYWGQYPYRDDYAAIKLFANGGELRSLKSRLFSPAPAQAASILPKQNADGIAHSYLFARGWDTDALVRAELKVV